MQKKNSQPKPKWLLKLQLNSWEPEILLSGIVLYGMFQVPLLLDQFLLFFSSEVYNDMNAMFTLVAILKIGVFWLIGGLILHLITRGLWVGMVGLSYTFPNGIKPDKLKFQPKYLAKVNDVPAFDQIVLNLERICSFIYSIAFLLFMSLVGTYIYATVLVIIPMVTIISLSDNELITNNLIQSLELYGNIVLSIGIIGVIDFLTMGYFRRFKLFAKLFWPFYKIFNFLTLSSFYRPTYFAVISNFKKAYVFIFLLFFIITSFIGISSVHQNNPEEVFSRLEIWNNNKGNRALEGFYQDKNSSNPSGIIQIPSDIINGNILRVFIPLSISMEDSIKKFIKYDSVMSSKKENFNKGRYFLKGLSNFYKLSIDDSIFNTKSYFQYNNSTNRKGIITYLNVGYLKEGLYELEMRGPKEMYKNSFAIVPFYKTNY
ncbi:hypothetical protein [Marivirga arenosa]|uniref:Uncharacterized protein n=1 Tax=Marivirga arenosa TaxID=3059076 RepID=A0AA51ZXF3_9BACT|nr:hypothetical protein [Marivirga sp. BKB1-2]WNB18490.1 hypothetical protein QYS47_30370 [Marivirga sp. BKB1-2]